MILTKEEIGIFINCYLGNTDHDFEGKIIEIGELKFGENENGTDYFLHLTHEMLLGKEIICVSSDAKGSLELMLLDDFGYFYEYKRNENGYRLTQIIPSVSDFKK